MEILLRILAFLLSFVGMIVNKVMWIMQPRIDPSYPHIRDPILLKSVIELVTELRRGEITSQQLVKAYIQRIQEVNPSLNAVIEDRFEAAMEEAKHADSLIANATSEFDRMALFARYSLLGVPFTVKESCALKGLSYEVGSVIRKNIKAPMDGDAVALVRAAGGIPLLVSATPEFCMSSETSSVANGRCLNPYDLTRSTAGSSGGEAALNGCGATPFGIASDICGSIRVPAMFCGVFGHIATAGLISNRGHFPNSTHEYINTVLRTGPITRFARDMPLLLEVMAGDNKDKLNIKEHVPLKEIKVYYAFGYTGLNALTHHKVEVEIEMNILRVVKSLAKAGCKSEKLDMGFLRNSLEISVVGLLDIEGMPSIVTQVSNRPPKMRLLLVELFNSLINHSLFTKEALGMEILKRFNCFISDDCKAKYREEAQRIKTYLTDLLGDRGVLIVPTFHSSAFCFNTSLVNTTGIDNLMVYNVMGLPATHVTLGLNQRGMPIGFQVIAAPYQDKLCLQIASEVEGAFYGWVPPVPHKLPEPLIKE